METEIQTALADLTAKIDELVQQNSLILTHLSLDGRGTYSIEQAARLTGLAEWTLRRACSTRRIEAAKDRPGPRGKWKISREVVAWLQENGLPPPPKAEGSDQAA